VTFVEQRALGRIEIFGVVVGIKRPRPKPDCAPPAVADRDYQPVAEAVVDVALVVADSDTRINDLILGIAEQPQVFQRLPLVVRRVAEHESLDGIGAEVTALDVIAGDLGGGRIEQLGVEELGSLVEQRLQAFGFGLPLDLLGRDRRQLDPGALRQLAQGVAEIPPFRFHDKAEDIAAITARAEAAPGLCIWEHDERRRPLVMKRAQRFEVAPRFLQVYIARYNINNVQSGLNVIYG